MLLRSPRLRYLFCTAAFVVFLAAVDASSGCGVSRDVLWGRTGAGEPGDGDGGSSPPGDGSTDPSITCARAVPADPIDITARVLANGGNDDILLEGKDYAITLPPDAPVPSPPDPDVMTYVPNAPTTYFHGVFSGTGTITVRVRRGDVGRFVLTNRSTYAVPVERQVQFTKVHKRAALSYRGVTFPDIGGDIHVVHHLNPPALFIEEGAIVQLGSMKKLVPDGGPAEIFSNVSRHQTVTSALTNFDNIQNGGVLVVTNPADTGAVESFTNVGAISGCGSVVLAPASGPGGDGNIRFSGRNTYAGGSIFHRLTVGDARNYADIQNARTVFNRSDITYNAPAKTIYENDDGKQAEAALDDTYFGNPGYQIIPSRIYEVRHGNHIHNIGRAGVDVFTGTYSYSDSGDESNPSLSDKRLDWTVFNGNASHRILSLHGGSITQFGDGTTDEIFVKGNPTTVTLSAQGAALGLFYAGKVSLDTSINDPGAVSRTHLFILGAPGKAPNHVVLTRPNYYYGATHIEPNAILQLGDGTPGYSATIAVKARVTDTKTVDGVLSTSGGNGSILTPGTGDGTGKNAVVGADTNTVFNDGQLIVDNVMGALSGVVETKLSHIVGLGSVTQKGSLPLTLLGDSTYSGGTTITSGTLIVASDTSLGTGPVTNDGVLALFETQHVVRVGTSYAQGAGGTLRLGVGGTGQGTSYDYVDVAGTATLAGTLVLSKVGAFTPVAGQKFIVVQAAGGRTGTFASVVANGFTVIAGYDATTAFVTVQ